MVSSELYLNKGELQFANITEQAGVFTDRWCTGVSIVDVNADGLKDIYVCVAGFEQINPFRENLLFINQGNDAEGIPSFEESAKLMGLNDDGYSTMGAFFDYDKDNDLDLFILSNWMDGNRRSMIRPIIKDGSGQSTDRLYENVGDNTFVNVSSQAGIVNEGYGLGVALCDINQDSWIDIYCANDFISNDILYINNTDGTFTDRSAEYFKHFTHNGMGVDIADYNNDALLDVMVLDMLPPDNERQKLMLGNNRRIFNQSLETGYHPQFLRNTLQLNRGEFQDGIPKFSEISYLAGVHQTDWSWAPILADFNNDGWKDLIVTNGFRKDVANQDYIEEIIEISRFGTDDANKTLIKESLSNLPDIKLKNFVYLNNKDLTFDDVSEQWGLIHETFSNGTVVADLDNDGDLDMVFNNIDSEATLYENTLNQHENDQDIAHYVKFRFDPGLNEHDKIGLKMRLHHGSSMQYVEYYPFRGYKSTLEEEIHIGLGNSELVDSVIVMWNDGVVNRQSNLLTDSIYILQKEQHQEQIPFILPEKDENKIPGFRETAVKHGLHYEHKAIPNKDFNISPTLIHSLSHYGPSISVGDINGDRLDDLMLGGDYRTSGTMFLQTTDATFERIKFDQDSIHHDVGTLLFDTDMDGDQDLYVVSGAYRFAPEHRLYQDRLYINDGLGSFTKDSEALPTIGSSGSCVIAADYDQDSDLDLFVGARLEGRNYPLTPKSFLLENDGGKFKDRSELLGASAGKLGMVTSAIWTDVNGDQLIDLMVVGEWMNVRLLLNNGKGFEDKSADFGLQDLSGWWNSINGADLDNDGDVDYVLGNYGLNSFFKASPPRPLEIYTKDFDRNGSIDPIVTHYIGSRQYPVHTFTAIEQIIPAMRNRFKNHTEFGAATFRESFTEDELEGVVRQQAKTLSSIVLENVDGSSFLIHELPAEVQFAPVFGSAFSDINDDGLQDILLVGNSMKEETVFGFYDASFGTVLINDGDFNFRSIEPSESNFIADGDMKAMAQLQLADGTRSYAISENGGPLSLFSSKEIRSRQIIESEQDDWLVDYQIEGKSRRLELYHGNGFLSTSTRKVSLPIDAKNIVITKFDGQKRSHDPTLAADSN